MILMPFPPLKPQAFPLFSRHWEGDIDATPNAINKQAKPKPLLRNPSLTFKVASGCLTTVEIIPSTILHVKHPQRL